MTFKQKIGLLGTLQDVVGALTTIDRELELALNQVGELVFVLGQKWLHSKSKTIVHCLCEIVVFSDLVDDTLV